MLIVYNTRKYLLKISPFPLQELLEVLMIRQHVVRVPAQLNKEGWYVIGLLGLQLLCQLLGALDHFGVGVGAVVSGGEPELAQVDVVCWVWRNQTAWHDLLEWKLARRGMGEHFETKMQPFIFGLQGQFVQRVLPHGGFPLILRLGQRFGKKVFALCQLSLYYFFLDQLQSYIKSALLQLPYSYFFLTGSTGFSSQFLLGLNLSRSSVSQYLQSALLKALNFFSISLRSSMPMRIIQDSIFSQSVIWQRTSDYASITSQFGAGQLSKSYVFFFIKDGALGFYLVGEAAFFAPPFAPCFGAICGPSLASIFSNLLISLSRAYLLFSRFSFLNCLCFFVQSWFSLKSSTNNFSNNSINSVKSTFLESFEHVLNSNANIFGSTIFLTSPLTVISFSPKSLMNARKRQTMRCSLIYLIWSKSYFTPGLKMFVEQCFSNLCRLPKRGQLYYLIEEIKEMRCQRMVKRSEVSLLGYSQRRLVIQRERDQRSDWRYYGDLGGQNGTWEAYWLLAFGVFIVTNLCYQVEGQGSY